VEGGGVADKHLMEKLIRGFCLHSTVYSPHIKDSKLEMFWPTQSGVVDLDHFDTDKYGFFLV
jgi:hypothetical protein